MMTKRLSRMILAALLFAVPLLFTSPAHAQMIVEDPSSIVVLIEQLVHQALQIDNEVQQIQNQIQSIENEKNMLAHLNLSTAAGALEAMQQIQQTLSQFCIGLQNQGISDPIGFGAGYNCGLVAQELRIFIPLPATGRGSPISRSPSTPISGPSKKLPRRPRRCRPRMPPSPT